MKVMNTNTFANKYNNIIYLNCGERYEDIVDHDSYVHNVHIAQHFLIYYLLKNVYLGISWSTVSTVQVQGFQRVTIFDQISSV